MTLYLQTRENTLKQASNGWDALDLFEPEPGTYVLKWWDRDAKETILMDHYSKLPAAEKAFIAIERLFCDPRQRAIARDWIEDGHSVLTLHQSSTGYLVTAWNPEHGSCAWWARSFEREADARLAFEVAREIGQ